MNNDKLIDKIEMRLRLGVASIIYGRGMAERQKIIEERMKRLRKDKYTAEWYARRHVMEFDSKR